MYMRDFLSFLHCHEVESFGNRRHREDTYNYLIDISVALTLQTFLNDYHYLVAAC